MGLIFFFLGAVFRVLAPSRRQVLGSFFCSKVGAYLVVFLLLWCQVYSGRGGRMDCMRAYTPCDLLRGGSYGEERYAGASPSFAVWTAVLSPGEGKVSCIRNCLMFFLVTLLLAMFRSGQVAIQSLLSIQNILQSAGIRYFCKSSTPHFMTRSPPTARNCLLLNANAIPKVRDPSTFPWCFQFGNRNKGTLEHRGNGENTETHKKHKYCYYKWHKTCISGARHLRTETFSPKKILQPFSENTRK